MFLLVTVISSFLPLLHYYCCSLSIIKNKQPLCASLACLLTITNTIHSRLFWILLLHPYFFIQYVASAPSVLLCLLAVNTTRHNADFRLCAVSISSSSNHVARSKRQNILYYYRNYERRETQYYVVYYSIALLT